MINILKSRDVRGFKVSRRFRTDNFQVQCSTSSRLAVSNFLGTRSPVSNSAHLNLANSPFSYITISIKIKINWTQFRRPVFMRSYNTRYKTLAPFISVVGGCNRGINYYHPCCQKLTREAVRRLTEHLFCLLAGSTFTVTCLHATHRPFALHADNFMVRDSACRQITELNLCDAATSLSTSRRRLRLISGEKPKKQLLTTTILYRLPTDFRISNETFSFLTQNACK